MSTDNMPNPPDRPTAQAAGANTHIQGTPGEAQHADTPPAQPVPLAEDIARIIEEQAEVIAQRHVYHAQLLYGVGGVAADPANATGAALVIAQALRSGDHAALQHALINLGDPQIAQVNDKTMPYRYNAQIAGLFEGILLDTIKLAYRDDQARQEEALRLLSSLFLPANEQLMEQPEFIRMFTAPAMSGPGYKLPGPDGARRT
jgi:hypothetical protein